ncbi:hypothetical protein F3Y22_tig00000715pilonHSYRG00374 [Hibiscus syriacus]|uniref:Cyclin-dependent protein kinase inhibitor SMR2 n=1 Tax=Hibiscus syriacus TaxID=106335 RepID=A0A6A3D6G2_HIBSY|nr:cyclin-dependent protein kinase inhibitor SMR2-like [Hibiscus syriacus]KAE8734849.1 hypothetical protein F3Y22_tig00000715pilonHSYRG00374 [Hibiscus syriacus]
MSKDHRENILQETLQKNHHHQRQEGGIEKDGIEEEERGLAAREEECKTPTSSDHKIPTIQSCPPTPKKKVRSKFALKRKLSEVQFFETTRREEVESFFRSNSEPFTLDSSRKFKRRCRSA